jgi:hypothetical protein
VPYTKRPGSYEALQAIKAAIDTLGLNARWARGISSTVAVTTRGASKHDDHRLGIVCCSLPPAEAGQVSTVHDQPKIRYEAAPDS